MANETAFSALTPWSPAKHLLCWVWGNASHAHRGGSPCPKPGSAWKPSALPTAALWGQRFLLAIISLQAWITHVSHWWSLSTIALDGMLHFITTDTDYRSASACLLKLASLPFFPFLVPPSSIPHFFMILITVQSLQHFAFCFSSFIPLQHATLWE